MNTLFPRTQVEGLSLSCMIIGSNWLAGWSFSWATIRDCNMVTVGCFNADEVYEDIEISLAALEHRRVNIEKRSSPNQKQDAFG